MKIKAVADLAKVSVRTLHYYDQIGLLTPHSTSETGYRLYSNEDIDRLQEILFFKTMGVPLKEIKELLDNPAFDTVATLKKHRQALILKKEKLDQLIENIDQTIKYRKGEHDMTQEEKFSGFNFKENPYDAEAREKWGDQAVDKVNKNTSQFTAETEAEIKNIYQKLAAIRTSPPQSDEAQKWIGEWFKCLNNNFDNYSLQAFKGLGQMYIADERFTENIDKYGQGLAQFMSDAMAYYSDNQ